MSLSDFERCTPSEFSAVAGRWRDHQDGLARRGWERTRFLAAVTLQPYSRKPVRSEDVARFPWDEGNSTSGGAPQGPPSTRERMEEIAARVRRAGSGTDAGHPRQRRRS